MNSPHQRPHRVLHVLPWVTSGGVERRRLQLIEGLSEARYEQRILCKQAQGDVVDRLRELGTPVEVIPGQWGPTDLDSMAHIMEYVREWRPDIIHGAVFEGVTMSSFCGYMSCVPHVLIEETGGTQWRSWRGNLLLAIAAMLSERCVAVSPHIGRYLAERSQLSEHKIKVIPNGTTLKPMPDDFKPASYRDELGIPQDALVIGSLGRVFDEFKRFSDLVRAFALLDPAHYTQPIYLVIGGGGPDYDSLVKLTKELGVADRVILPGRISAPQMLYSVMDLFALVSASESFGLVVVEAMSAGLPVIASRVDAFPDIIDEGRSGLLVPVRDPGALAQAIDGLLKDPDRREALGTHAKIVAERDYSSRRYVADVDAFYQSLLYPNS